MLQGKQLAFAVSITAGISAVIGCYFIYIKKEKKKNCSGKVQKLEVVGGHGSKKDKGPPILFREGQVLKPFQAAQPGKKKSRGELEADFYKEVTEGNKPLKPFIPKYFGLEQVDGSMYLNLENLLYGIKDACILDLKMGQQTFDETASPEKIAKEKKKYPPQAVIGFRCSGMKVSRPASGDVFNATREWCMSIVPETMQSAISEFFYDGKVLKYDLIRQFLEKLEEIEKMLRTGPEYRMYGSSLLVVYDASSKKPQLRVKMIDFAHIFPIKDGGVDDGYLHGIKFLGNCLRLTLAMKDTSEAFGNQPSQIGGAHNNIAFKNGELIKKEDKKEAFDFEVSFYRKAWDTSDILTKVMPKLIRVNENCNPREMVISDATTLVLPKPSLFSSTNQAVSIMDIKLGTRSFRKDCPNEPQTSYFSKYKTFENSLAPGKAEKFWKDLVNDPNGPKALQKGKLGKRDYLSFRDATTTSLELGFRLTALVHGDYKVSQNESKCIDTKIQFLERLEHFLYSERGFDRTIATAFLEQLELIQHAALQSKMFKSHDMVGSSLLFLYSNDKAVIRWIDFANSTVDNSAGEDNYNGILHGLRCLSMAINELNEKYSS